MEFITELKKLGLKDKEAAVYLACLELGPSPVQTIARKSKVVRATTYVVLDVLMNLGLVTKFKEGKKTLFSAEPPRQLKRLLEKQEEEVKEKQEELDVLLPELQMLVKTTGIKPSVRYFEGKEGLRAMRQEIMMYCHPGDTIYNFTPLDHLLAVFAESESAYSKQRIAKGIHSKTIFTTKSQKVREEALQNSQLNRLGERRYVPPEKFPMVSGFTVYRDRIAMGSFTGKLMGVIVESQPMTEMMHRLFELAWSGAAQYEGEVKQ